MRIFLGHWGWSRWHSGCELLWSGSNDHGLGILQVQQGGVNPVVFVGWIGFARRFCEIVVVFLFFCLVLALRVVLGRASFLCCSRDFPWEVGKCLDHCLQQTHHDLGPNRYLPKTQNNEKPKTNKKQKGKKITKPLKGLQKTPASNIFPGFCQARRESMALGRPAG